MRRPVTVCCFFLLALGLLLLPLAHGADPASRNVILSTTTSTQDSGLLDVLIPLFEKQTGYPVKTVSVGTGQALALAAKGDADVALGSCAESGETVCRGWKTAQSAFGDVQRFCHHRTEGGSGEDQVGENCPCRAEADRAVQIPLRVAGRQFRHA